ncbi:50S ribosomal protein L32 [Neorickettsia findlayensis]|uniref:Large ribosomal subunit protein bL32 n=1 Tax=Neorickettsia findlayensis TaxID=2686014 RepID=A0A6P1GAD4_9RICK|nr:50S ribosomal protein L32 [Neorickettsia findlayensis]QHD65315.1 50S ribosomal protein L32 [Neorickettsia findlayensis]
MPVPKRKTTPARRGKRRSHDALRPENIVVNKTTGEFQRPHHVSLDGFYNGRRVLSPKGKAVSS